MGFKEWLQDLIAPEEVAPLPMVPPGYSSARAAGAEDISSPTSSQGRAATPFSSARAAGAEDILGSNEIDSWRGTGMVGDPSNPMQDWYEGMLEQILSLGGSGNANAAAAAAKSAYNPVLAALDAEMGSAKKRSAQNRKRSRDDYKGMENQYRLERRAAIKTNVLQAEKANKEMAKTKTATAQEYNKLQAEQNSELSGRGVVGSAQALAKNALAMQGAQQMAGAEEAAVAQRNLQREMGRTNEQYLSSQIPVTRTQRAETDLAMSNKLEEVLNALNKEKAGVSAQAASAANSARQSNTVNPMDLIKAQMELYSLAASQAPEGSAGPEDFGEGAGASTSYISSLGLPDATRNSVLNFLNNSPELRNGYTGDSVTKGDLTPAAIRNLVLAQAEKEGWSDPQLLDAIVRAASMDAGLYRAPKQGSQDRKSAN